MLRKISATLLCTVPLCLWAASEKPPGYAVVTASPYASRIGMKILQEGGNAFDAAVAVTAALAVTEPYHSGIGGGGFWLLYDAKNDKNIFVDGREVAPIAATAKMYLDESGKPIKKLSLFGPMAAAIPGEPAAIAHIAEKYGKLPLTKTLAPAINLAHNGFKVDELYRSIVLNRYINEHLMSYPSTSSIFAPNGKAPKVGSYIIQTDLANTLTKLAQLGKKGFYEGEVAATLVHEVRKHGGIWSLRDLKEYHVVEREPLEGEYMGTKIITAPPPSAGGISLLSMLNILSNYPLSTLPEAQQIHLTIEAMRLAYWDRAEFLGDPDFVTVPVAHLTSLKHAKRLQHFIKQDKATFSEDLDHRENSFEDTSENTTHFSIIDADGNKVSATLSVNFLFGSNFVANGTGVVLNNEMDDFAIKPGTKNVFGLVGGENNSIAPKKRPLSSMSPTFLVAPSRQAILGTPGGSRIPTMLLLSTLAFVNGKTPMYFVPMQRYHHQYMPDVVEYENDAFSLPVSNELTKMGYHLEPLNKDYGSRSFFYGDMQALEWNIKNDALIACSDPRHIGLALVHYDDNK